MEIVLQNKKKLKARNFFKFKHKKISKHTHTTHRKIATRKEKLRILRPQHPRRRKVRMHQSPVEPPRTIPGVPLEEPRRKVLTHPRSPVRPRIRTLVRHKQVKLRTRRHRMLAEGVLVGEVLGNDRVQGDGEGFRTGGFGRG